MPRPRRTTSRRKRRRVMRPTTMGRRVGLTRRMPNFNVKRTMVEPSYSINNVWSGALWTFRLDKLPDYTEFNALFTHYRINAVKMLFVPSADSLENTAQLNQPVRITTPRVYAFVDRDSQPPLASENAVLQHSGLKIIRNPLRPFSVYVKGPAVAEYLQTTTAGAYSGLRSRQWIACDSPSVNHFGVVTGGIVPFSAGGGSMSYNVIVTYYLQFRGTQ